jgi:hypothetical protein
MTRIPRRAAGLRAARLFVERHLHADMAGDKAEALVEAVRVGACVVAGQLDETAARGARDFDRVAN